MQEGIEAHMWRGENKFQDLILSLRHVGSRDGTQVIGLGSKPLLTEPFQWPMIFQDKLE